MSAIKKSQLISVADYLASEKLSPIKREYVGGHVYERADSTNQHNLIASNVIGSLYARLRGKPCRPYNSDTKIRVRLPTQLRFYYPDASVICRSGPPEESFQDEPVVIVEVLSRATRRTDEGEKKDAYLLISSLSVYVLIEQESPAVVLYRRTDQGFIREEYDGLEATIPLPEIQAELPLAEVYEGVAFIAEE